MFWNRLHNHRNHRNFRIAGIVLGLTLSSLNLDNTIGSAAAQDIVFTRSSKGTETPRKGVIVDWQADTLTIEIGGREKTIKGSEIVRVQTVWSEQYQTGLQFFQQRKFSSAIGPLTEASQIETRDWARSIILAKLTQCFSLQEDFGNAANAFGQIIAVDPQSRFTYLIPLPWDRAFVDGAIIERAKQWQRSENETFRLLGASWLLGSPVRESALAELDELSRSADPRIAHLASIQLWRGRSVSATEKDLARWETQIKRMPAEIRAGALFIAGEIKFRLKQDEDAALDFLQIPILHNDNLRLSAIGLQKAANSLQNAGKAEEAEIVLRELVRDYANTRFAVEAESKLQSLPKN